MMDSEYENILKKKQDYNKIETVVDTLETTAKMYALMANVIKKCSDRYILYRNDRTGYWLKDDSTNNYIGLHIKGSGKYGQFIEVNFNSCEEIVNITDPDTTVSEVLEEIEQLNQKLAIRS